ncbi:hypothetical protein U1Q18_043522 [Sarracenia purpurea var. burkii]
MGGRGSRTNGGGSTSDEGWKFGGTTSCEQPPVKVGRFKWNNGKQWSKKPTAQRSHPQEEEGSDEDMSGKHHRKEAWSESRSNRPRVSSPEHCRNQTPTGEDKDQSERSNPKMVMPEVPMEKSEKSAMQRDWRQTENHRIEKVTFPYSGRRQYGVYPEEVDQIIMLSKGANPLKPGPDDSNAAHEVRSQIGLALVETDQTNAERNGPILIKPGPDELEKTHKDLACKEIKESSREPQPHLSPKSVNVKIPLSQGGDGAEIKKKVSTWKKKARSSNGASMQIEGLTGTKRNADFVTDAEDSRELAGESTKKIRYENLMAIDHPFIQSVEADSQPHREL